MQTAGPFRRTVLIARGQGAEADRRRGYRDEERVTPEMMHEYDPARLICSHSRMVSDRRDADRPIKMVPLTGPNGKARPSWE